MGIIGWLIVGLVAGAIAGGLTGARIGIVGSIILGIVGAVVGNYLFGALGVHIPFGHPILHEIVVGVVGAALLVLVARFLERA